MSVLKPARCRHDNHTILRKVRKYSLIDLNQNSSEWRNLRALRHSKVISFYSSIYLIATNYIHLSILCIGGTRHSKNRTHSDQWGFSLITFLVLSLLKVNCFMTSSNKLNHFLHVLFAHYLFG